MIARNSTFAFKNQPTDLREVGRRLGVRYLVEGSSRRAGDQLRIVAQLIDADSGAHLWSRSYDAAVDNAALARRLHPLAPDYCSYVHALHAAERLEEAVLRDCRLKAPAEPNCLRMQAVSLAGLERPIEARSVMNRLLQIQPGFTLADERRLRRFGDSPETHRYLADLAAAGAPPGTGEAALARRAV